MPPSGERNVAKQTLRWVGFVSVPLSVYLVVAWLHQIDEPPGAQMLDRAEFVASPAASGEPRILPDDWRRAPTRGVRAGWYRIRFRAHPATHAYWAVYLPSLGMNAAVYLNGHFLGDGGSFVEPVARNWARPLLFPFARSLLDDGDNVLAVRVRADRDDGGFLAPVYVGSYDHLVRAHHRRHMLKITAVWVITLCLVLVAAFTAALWLQWPEQADYGWFAAAMLAWALIHTNVLVVAIPVHAELWSSLWDAAILLWAALLMRFLVSFLGDEDPTIEHRFLGVAAAGAAVCVFLGFVESPWLDPVAHAWSAIAAVVMLHASVRVVRVLHRRGHELAVAFPNVLGAGVVGCVAHDWLVFVGLGGHDYYVPYAAPPMLVGMGSALLRRFVDALRASEASVAALEERVRAKRDELEQSYRQLESGERARTLADERERILREMHDGLGSHLVSTLALLDRDSTPREAIGEAIRGALDDLRRMFESLEPLEGDLVGALAMLRARLAPRLEAAGVRTDWRVSELPAMPTLGPRVVLQILRVLEEAMTNVLKHAEARTIVLRTGETDDGSAGARYVFVELVDDGRGFDGRAPGRGLSHMSERAAEIGARLAIRSEPGCTTVRLDIPRELP